MATRRLNGTLPLTVSETEAKLLFAVKLYEVGRISLGQAARLAGFSLRGFLDVLGQHKISVFNYSPEDLRAEIES